MDIFQEIIDSLKTNEDTEIRIFGQHYIEEKIGSGQQGIVLKIGNNINKKFALKLYRPTDSNPEILKKGVERFKKEINILATLNHKNVIKIFTGGTARWIEAEKRWNVKEGFDEEIEPDCNELVYYYIMDYISGSSNIISIFPELADENDPLENQEIHSTYKSLKLFEDLIAQVSNAMSYYHSKEFTHRDIKPENILFCEDDSTFVIADFGFAHHFTSSSPGEIIVRTDIIDYESIDAQDYEKNDMGQFSRMLLKILPSFENEYDGSRYQGIKHVLEKGKHQKLELRYNNMLDFYNSINQFFLTNASWKFQLKLNEYMCPKRFGRFNSKVRIPVSGSVLLSKEVRTIIDTPEFQRLRGVRQLGPTIFVFPGSNHTRFEHSIGAYNLSLKYLERLYDLPEFKEICPTDESIKLILLSALLHDIGHYPYSHWIEEIDFPKGIKFMKHEERARKIINSENIHDIIQNQWDIDTNILSDIIASKYLDSNKELINSFISSIIDVDKIDYLIRDSVHCGVNYGKGIDVERLLDSLYIDSDKKKICLTEKGSSMLLSILSCRNIMYQEVYWHKTVRSCEAMFKRFLYEYITQEIEDVAAVEKYFNFSDDQFTFTLYNKSKNNDELNKLISPFAFENQGRRLYKPAYIFFNRDASEEPHDTREFFRSILNRKYEDIVNISNRLVENLKNEIPDIKPLDIILEQTPIKEHEQYELEGFKIWNTRKHIFEGYSSEMKTLNQYLKNNQQAYIFCNPKYYNKLKELTLNNKLNTILAELY